MPQPIETRAKFRTSQPDGDEVVKVWDIPTRLFHWSTVTLVVVSWISADQGYMIVHLISGLSLLTLILFRIVWGFFGSTTSRFSDFLRHPKAVLNYLRSKEHAGHQHYAGHNPAGGLMVIALIGVLLTQAATGLFSNDGVRFSGPLALRVSSDASDIFTKIHRLTFDAILILVWMHVVAVFFYLCVKRENLILPMLTGLKRRRFLPKEFSVQFTSAFVAVIIVVVICCLVKVVLF